MRNAFGFTLEYQKSIEQVCLQWGMYSFNNTRGFLPAVCTPFNKRTRNGLIFEKWGVWVWMIFTRQGSDSTTFFKQKHHLWLWEGVYITCHRVSDSPVPPKWHTMSPGQPSTQGQPGLPQEFRNTCCKVTHQKDALDFFYFQSWFMHSWSWQ